MNVARKILESYGWKDGDGLGKNNDGIAKPLKAALKFDKTGFGADQAAEDFNNHWWERVYNDAANNVKISKDGERIKMDLKDHLNTVEISTKNFSMRKLKKFKQNRNENDVDKNGYGNFLQAATLNNLGSEVENPDKINTNDIEVTKINILTDEELFKACNGRTAHKGARHGLNLSGKLSRIERQESELLAKILANRETGCKDKVNEKLYKKCKQYEESKEYSTKESKQENSEDAKTQDECDFLNIKSKKKKSKKHKFGTTEVTEIANNEIPIAQIKKKKKDYKNVETVENDNQETKKKKIKRKSCS